jgi:hypothetical protein
MSGLDSDFMCGQQEYTYILTGPINGLIPTFPVAIHRVTSDLGMSLEISNIPFNPIYSLFTV